MSLGGVAVAWTTSWLPKERLEKLVVVADETG